ncbi:type VI secretion system protein TssA [Gallaecimonas xiamenensis]|uniref:ImpA domain-containing protein n=1 Tax=Gallaecimonas xiamenensis 3-C-1 TaxID=745411 RepID=K2JK03_9GAMM|nr:type VI secretion system protein TssA [Gallaecimonas xiamenensis]EKE75633.1 ImpA domain-containing protein [Gallaecimonas xiamenensis 3-C-1]
MSEIVVSLFDLDAVLAPISDDNPCGLDTREDVSPASPYFTFKDVRSQARALERQAVLDDDYQPPSQWRELSRALPEILQTSSKDLELVAWLIEAWCREYGFLGLGEGFVLATRLIESHWDQLYPLPDEDGAATRLAPLVGLNGLDAEGTLLQPMLSIPLFMGQTYGPFATWHCEQAAEINRLDKDKAEQKIRGGAASFEQIAQTVREMPASELVALADQIEFAQQSFQGLSDAMDSASQEPQPTSQITKALRRCRDVLWFHAGEIIEKAREQAQAVEPEDSQVAAEAGAEPGSGLPAGADPIEVAIKGREQAVKQLGRLADFFRQTEPHSPVSYAIEQAIRWSKLTLPELMQELISDEGARTGFCRLTGVPGAGDQE